MEDDHTIGADQSRFDFKLPGVKEESQVDRNQEESGHQVGVEAEVHQQKVSQEDSGKYLIDDKLTQEGLLAHNDPAVITIRPKKQVGRIRGTR